MINRIIYYTLFCFSLCSRAQQHPITNTKLIESKIHYGFLMPHHTSIEYSVNGHIPAFEINYLHQTDGNNMWDNSYRLPRIGIGLSYFYLQDHNIFGSSYSTYGLFNFPLFRYKELSAFYRMYTGLCWINKTWDIENNYLQTAIGSHINMYFRTSINVCYQIKPKAELTMDIGLTHFSNGNIKVPNLGLNIITTSMGIVFFLQDKKSITTPKIQIEKPNKINLQISYAGGFRTIGNFKNSYYYKSSFNIHTGYNFSYKRQLGLGLDLFYDGIQQHKSLKDNNKAISEKFQSGLVIFQDLRYKKLILSIQVGYYIINRDEYFPVYNRNGLKYYFNKNMCAIVCLKSHKTKADYIEWGIGYSM